MFSDTENLCVDLASITHFADQASHKLKGYNFLFLIIAGIKSMGHNYLTEYMIYLLK